METNNKKKVILDLCGGTGAWSAPYKKNGYTVHNITLPKYDITKEIVISYCKSLNPYGTLFAAPCTMWSNVANAHWKKRTSDEIFHHVRILIAGLRIIHETNPVFWCIENPKGKMRQLLGEPKFKFHPFEFGDNYTKLTYLWGKFNLPIKKDLISKNIKRNFTLEFPPGPLRQERR